MKILVAHDGSPQADKAMREAASLARCTGGDFSILNVVPDLCLSSEEVGPSDCDMVSMSLHKDAQGAMRKVQEELTAMGAKADIVVREGHPAEAIVKAAEELGVDMVVLGAHGRHGAKRFLMGSVSAKVAEYSKVNVLIVK